MKRVDEAILQRAPVAGTPREADDAIRNLRGGSSREGAAQRSAWLGVLGFACGRERSAHL